MHQPSADPQQTHQVEALQNHGEKTHIASRWQKACAWEALYPIWSNPVWLVLKAFIYWVSHERAVKALLIGVMYFKAVRSSFWTPLQMLVVFKSAPILKRALKVKQAMMQLYVLKLLKIQTKYLGRQWRKSNMKTMSAIYQKVRHRLNDDWAYGNGKKHSVLIQKGSKLLVLGYKWSTMSTLNKEQLKERFRLQISQLQAAAKKSSCQKNQSTWMGKNVGQT